MSFLVVIAGMASLKGLYLYMRLCVSQPQPAIAPLITTVAAPQARSAASTLSRKSAFSRGRALSLSLSLCLPLFPFCSESRFRRGTRGSTSICCDRGALAKVALPSLP